MLNLVEVLIYVERPFGYASEHFTQKSKIPAGNFQFLYNILAHYTHSTLIQLSSPSSIDPLPALPYHVIVAVRKPNTRSGQQKKPLVSQAAVFFWLIFIVIIIIIFMANRDTIKENYQFLKSRLSDPSKQRTETPLVIDEEPVTPPSHDEPAVSAPIGREPVVSAPAVRESIGREPAVHEPPAKPQPPAPEKPAVQSPPAQTRDRSIYFTQIDKDGQILRFKVSRKLAVSDSPLHDVLNALLAGPTSQELNRGVISLIPPNTRVLSAIVRGNTAYISFSEDFRFNTFGVEGYAAHLRFNVWAATEFYTVNDVQILIEGRRVDYLGEGIWIGSPLIRQSL
jgi:hypothetical protein